MVHIANTINSIAVLFVEDDTTILELQASLLAMRFPEVVFYTATNGKSGLELFKMNTPDIIITDINMSEMCGVQMSNAIRALKPDTKFIAITGKSDNHDFEFDHLIIKPVELSKLFSIVEQCISEIKQRIS